MTDSATLMTDADIAEILRNEPAFAKCPGPMLARFMGHVGVRTVAAGEPLQTLGDTAMHAFLILDGAFRVTANEGNEVILDSGFLGEEAVIQLDSYVSTAVATVPSTVLFMPGDAIWKLCEYRPVRKSLLASFSGRFIHKDKVESAKDWNLAGKITEPPGKALGWLVAVVAPVLVVWYFHEGGGEPLERNLVALLSIISSTVAMWAFRLLPDFVPALFAVLASILFGLSTPEIALGGFGSDSFFMAMSILGLSAVLTISGLSYRALLWLLRLGPANKVWYNFCLFLTGVVLTPVIPTTNGRVAVVAPFLTDLLSAMDSAAAHEEAPRLSMNVVGGISLLSAVFLSSKSVNFVIFGMLPPQEQHLFQWLHWFYAASVCGGALLVLYAIGNWLVFRNQSRPSISKALVHEQLATLGPMTPAEWAGVTGLLLLLAASMTAALHRVEVPWVAMAILFSLLMFGFLNKADFRQRVDWSFLIFLGALIGLVSVIRDVGMDAWLTANMSWLNTYMSGDFFTFVVMLSVTIFLVRLALPINATVVIFASLLIPTALATGFNPWLTGFIILLMAEGFVWPYQASYYGQFVSLVGPEGRADDRRMVVMNILISFFKLAAIYISIPFWRSLGIL